MKSLQGDTPYKVRGLLLGLSVLVVLGVGWFTISYVHAWNAPYDDTDTDTDPPSRPEPRLESILLRAGLGARELAAAGMSASEATILVDTVQASIASDPTVLERADQTYFEARNAHDVLERRVRSGLASPEEVQAYPAAKQALEAATNAREQILNTAFATGTGNLSQSKRDALSHLRSSTTWEIAIEFRVVQRTQQEWVDVRAALANERISLNNGEEPDPVCQALLAQSRAVPEVAAAKVNLEANLGSIQSAWNAAASE